MIVVDPQTSPQTMVRDTDNELTVTTLIGSVRDAIAGKSSEIVEGSPQAVITTLPPNATVAPHFHRVNQFQVFTEGDGRIGRHSLAPIVVHYTDGFTTYGPIVSGGHGLSYYVLRGATDDKGHYMPESKDFLRTRPPREQQRRFTEPFIEHEPVVEGDETLMATILFEDPSDGLRAAVHSYQPRASVTLPHLAGVSGEFILILQGAVLDPTSEHSIELEAPILLYRRPGPSGRITAGHSGFTALLMSVPVSAVAAPA